MSSLVICSYISHILFLYILYYISHIYYSYISYIACIYILCTLHVYILFVTYIFRTLFFLFSKLGFTSYFQSPCIFCHFWSFFFLPHRQRHKVLLKIVSSILFSLFLYFQSPCIFCHSWLFFLFARDTETFIKHCRRSSFVQLPFFHPIFVLSGNFVATPRSEKQLAFLTLPDRFFLSQSKLRQSLAHTHTHARAHPIRTYYAHVRSSYSFTISLNPSSAAGRSPASSSARRAASLRGEGRLALAPSCCTHYSTRIFPRLDLCRRGTRQ